LWQAPGGILRQNTEQGAARRDPGKRALEHLDGETAIQQIAYREGRQRVVGGEVRTEQGAGGLDAFFAHEALKGGRRCVHDRNRITDEGQRRPNVLADVGIAADREVTRLPPRRGSQLGQVDRQPLLQLPRPARGDQCWTGRPTADVDQKARAIGL
jgi:hypothetical protein